MTARRPSLQDSDQRDGIDSNPRIGDPTQPSAEFHSLELMVLLLRRKWLTLSVTLAIAALASIAAFLIPNTYTASTTIAPPLDKESAGAALTGELQTLTGLPAAALGVIDPAELCIRMLKSRSVQNAIVDQLDLGRVYSTKGREYARGKLDHNTEILAGKEGQITITVSDRDPDRASQIANAYVEQLRLLYQRFARSEASQRLAFYEKRIVAERHEMSMAELSLSQAQEKNGLVQPDAQTRAAVDSVVRIRAQIGMAEAELQAMRLYATPENADLQRAQAEIAELREQLAKLERGGDAHVNGDPEIPALGLPQAQLEYVRRARDLGYHEALYSFLTKQADAARLDEVQQGTPVEVIDEAKVPEASSGPPRLMIVLVSTGVAFLLCCLWVLLAESLHRRTSRAGRLSQTAGSISASLLAIDPAAPPASIPLPGAAIELCVLFVLLGLGMLAFAFGWLSVAQAAGGAAVFLCCLDLLAWFRFDQGRHPCFLFLCVLTLLQAGRSLAYLLGDGSNPLRIAGIAPHPFDLTRTEDGTVLLCLALSALCMYGVSRWNYRKIMPPSADPVARYLPFLYMVFYGTLPIQLYKNYSYYDFIQQHGGYLYLWTNRGDIVSSVPFLVRAIVLINAPAFLAIFVFEKRKKWLYLATISYFVTSSFILLIGYRSGVFALVLVLWYVAKIKSATKSRIVAIAALASLLVVVGSTIQVLRADDQATFADYVFAPLDFIRMQGNSIDVTSVAVKYENILAPHALSYAWYDLQDAFVLGDMPYVQGQDLANDVSVLLNPVAFSRGLGAASSYLGQMYLLGGVAGVIILSLLLGGMLHLLYRYSRDARSLFIVASILPAVILMPRGQLLGWVSLLVKTGISVAILWLGWRLYRAVLWLAGSPTLTASAPDA